jgi:hypothetical protein
VKTKYRYTRAVLDGSKFALWVARILGVEAKLLKLELTREEARELGLVLDGEPMIAPPPGFQNDD